MMDIPCNISAAELLNRIRNGKHVQRAIVEGDIVARDVEFADHVALRDVHFTGTVDFSSCTFRGGISVVNCMLQDAAFGHAEFHGAAYFWRTHFSGAATFDNAVVHCGGLSQGSVDDGEFNVSWARFGGPASFVRLRVHGPAHFWRTIFVHNVTMDESLFANGVRFMGRESEISLDLTQLGGVAIYDQLLQCGLIKPDPEEAFGPGRSRFAQLAGLSTSKTPEEDLCRALNRTKVPTPVRQALLVAFKVGALPMFTPGRRVSLCRLEIGAPGKSVLQEIDMTPCRLLGTDLRGIRVENLKWPGRRIAFGLIRRNATADELDATNATVDVGLRKLYRDLAAIYESQLDATEAIRFRIADRELSRKDLPLVARILSWCERQLSAYSTSPGIALWWLMVLVIFIVPSLLVLLGKPESMTSADTHSSTARFAAAVVRSLEIAAFLKDSDPQSTLPLRFLAGIERIVVTAQLTLFLLSLRRITWRTAN